MRVLGTAGHVDHGKSSLVRALTGIDPDRLKEEKARGMTIDLGFAWIDLPGNDATPVSAGIVDVPGHIDFIKNMLAGVGGVDAALLVIAADEGVMPQTREHLAILDLLAVPAAVVALTKIDLIDDPEWLDLVTLDVADLLMGTHLAGASIVPVSAVTGAGLDDLKRTLAGLLADLPPHATAVARACPSTASSPSAALAPLSPARCSTASSAWARRWKSCPHTTSHAFAPCKPTAARSTAAPRQPPRHQPDRRRHR